MFTVYLSGSVQNNIIMVYDFFFLYGLYHRMNFKYILSEQLNTPLLFTEPMESEEKKVYCISLALENSGRYNVLASQTNFQHLSWTT